MINNYQDREQIQENHRELDKDKPPMDASSSMLSISLFFFDGYEKKRKKRNLRGYSLYSSGLSGYQFGRTKEITLALISSGKSHGNPAYDVINVMQQPRRRIRANPCVFFLFCCLFFYFYFFHIGLSRVRQRNTRRFELGELTLGEFTKREAISNKDDQFNVSF